MRRAHACTKIADLMVGQNNKMLAGLRAVQAAREGEAPPPKVDFVARNISNVAPQRSLIGRREQALLARAEVMAAASAHLGGGAPHAMQQQRPARGLGGSQQQLSVGGPMDPSSAELLKAAAAEIERGYDISAIEKFSRRAPPKATSLGKGKAFTGAVTGSISPDFKGYM